MENQHRQISGYRELTREDLDLMNEAKDLEAQVLAFHAKVGEVLRSQSKRSSVTGDTHFWDAQAYRWHDIAATDIETGFMALVRSIAQPQPRPLPENDHE